MRRLGALTILIVAIAGYGMLRNKPPPPILPGPALSFAADIQPIIGEKCSPCHFPEGGRKPYIEYPLDSYEKVKAEADEVMEQVWTERHMPRRKTMTDDERMLVARWIEQGAAP
jgi:uncharacterized membrane protein